jgi:hypothetical protein
MDDDDSVGLGGILRTERVDQQRVLGVGALLGRCGMNSSSISGLATPRFRIPIRASSCCLYDSMAACAMRPSSKNGEARC